ncbi:DUF420 domain-containing protein [Hydrogenimonas cancrithermarum]|uniref:DUF420 domain-containing protein n=1 Tax=Hydrogenimonas cancrithermarum TaxID=2993563 RepID=A0ABM8FKS6_9BACT|nr:DUF420 domain-containing protein [Hydrogenimonas cancrithermarum]BDY12915.1 hypothetical protein HCR_12270 [Hydrogenimonas cancrithermarum]BDY13032.1 hypothetical protein HCR_13440 [Hydrogenimonas cancrithermarum]
MFETGFFGTAAPFYMDLATLYFTLLPLLMGGAVMLAVRRRLRLHAHMQTALFAATMAMVLFFEVGVRIDGGYRYYIARTSIPETAMALYMVVHVTVALVAVVAWGYLVIRSLKTFRQRQPMFAAHRRIGRWVFVGMALTSLMGLGVYWLLFVQGVS